MISNINKNQKEGLARVSDSLASLSIATTVIYLTGHLSLRIRDVAGLFLAIGLCLAFGLFFRRE